MKYNTIFYQDFTERGEVSITQLSSKSAEFTLSMTSPHKFHEENVSDFQNLIDNNGYYQIRTRSIPGDNSSPYVLASINAVRRSSFEFLNILKYIS